MKQTTFLYIVLLLSCWACTDVLELDLEDEDQVQLLAPANGLKSNSQTQTFWYQLVDYPIDGYQLKIVSPSFDSIETVVTLAEVSDSEVYETSLAPGIYQWTIIAYNSTSETEPIIRDLEISNDSTGDLSQQSIVLVSPEENLVTSDKDLTFLWRMLAGVEQYRIQIASPNFNNSTFIQDDQLTATDSYSTTLEEGTYRWRVRAENISSVSAYSERSLTIDETPPTVPTLVSPLSADSINLPVLLDWTSDTESVEDTLAIYTDSLSTSPILKLALTATNYTFSTSNSAEEFFWQVRSVDAAGNAGEYSIRRKFIVR